MIKEKKKRTRLVLTENDGVSQWPGDGYFLLQVRGDKREAVTREGSEWWNQDVLRRKRRQWRTEIYSAEGQARQAWRRDNPTQITDAAQEKKKEG